MKLKRHCLPLWNSPSPNTSSSYQHKPIEAYTPGYPQFSALISSHPPFFILRRFDRLRARVLLQKQDKLSLLEQQLDAIDDAEECPLFLGVSRCDANVERAAVLSEIEEGLGVYDNLLERTSRIFSLDPARQGDITSLQNWLDGNGCIARDEVSYLSSKKSELICLAPVADNATVQLERCVERTLCRVFRKFSNNKLEAMSTDKSVFIYPGSIIRQIAKGLLLSLIALLLILPVVVCIIVQTPSVRIGVVVLSTVVYLIILSILTKCKTMELIVAAATYSTVLIVFVSGTSGIQGAVLAS